ncbi:hypothetical protein GCM10010116_11120 [Microbispora rosea subsp. aerata]|nr:SGNH/GDSL hydrolase family protein [Microbispora rosea]GGO05664.1 hypothetical protein GCM10010116_11120 [Microbispora rosea subsp. aerata]GIH57298.1 hypothetical protein Mro02_42120 [Microbispora rosea subsp. aerata]GLJ83439.1 hypothetical protein GCM10017588_21670 [Microbispora rosea subsp. aerata]
MKLQREVLTPQMADYDRFFDHGNMNYQPYLMYFHQQNFRSKAVNSDRSGFRLSVGPDGERASAASYVPPGPVRLLSGSSTALGMGATGDEHTLASLLWRRYAPSGPWLNFAGRCYNSTQELLLFTLYRHLLPEIDEIVIFSGFNDLTVARLPEWQQGDHGAFWFCGEYYAAMDELRERNRKTTKVFGKRSERVPPRPIATFEDVRRDIDAVIESAAELTLRHLDTWRRLAGPETRISYVLQPMFPWMGKSRSPEEKLLFDEIDRISKLGTWEELYGDISKPEVARRFAEAIQAGCEKSDVRFYDLNPPAAALVDANDWIFVDRAHYTDKGHDVIARLLAETLELS